ncbi:MAG: spoIIIJ-associated protein [Eubacteriales bacterium]|nr:spoIIIJ-associated protein [Eubacteriales bacterium]MDN5363579.1 spoIIIJ-associated protein [Eubacteriales bacterium]
MSPREIEKSGKTVEEAVKAALAELGLTLDEVEVEVLEEGSKGFFGILGARQARVRVREKIKEGVGSAEETAEEGKEAALDREEKGEPPLDPGFREATRAFLTQVLAAMGIEGTMEMVYRDGYLHVTLYTRQPGALIGKRGETLNALQYIVNLVVNKNRENKVGIILDTEGYRERRAKALRRLAIKSAEKVRKYGKKIVLEPMTPQERRIIHTSLQGFEGVTTYSEGEEPYRKIVISPKK